MQGIGVCRCFGYTKSLSASPFCPLLAPTPMRSRPHPSAAGGGAACDISPALPTTPHGSSSPASPPLPQLHAVAAACNIQHPSAGGGAEPLSHLPTAPQPLPGVARTVPAQEVTLLLHNPPSSHCWHILRHYTRSSCEVSTEYQLVRSHALCLPCPAAGGSTAPFTHAG